MYTVFYDKRKGSLLICLVFILTFIALITIPKLFEVADEYMERRSRGTVTVALTPEERSRLEGEIRDLSNTLQTNPPASGQPRADFYRNLAVRYEQLGKLNDALRFYEKGTTEAPTDTKLLLAQSRILGQIGSLAKGEEMIKKAIELEPLEISHYSQAAFFYRTYGGDNESARGVYLEGLIKTNNNTNLMREFAGFLEEIGEGYEAYLYWSALQEKLPKDETVKQRIEELSKRYRDMIKKEKESLQK